MTASAPCAGARCDVVRILIYVEGVNTAYEQGAGDMDAALDEAANIVRYGYYHRTDRFVDVFPPHRIKAVTVVPEETEGGDGG